MLDFVKSIPVSIYRISFSVFIHAISLIAPMYFLLPNFAPKPDTSFIADFSFYCFLASVFIQAVFFQFVTIGVFAAIAKTINDSIITVASVFNFIILGIINIAVLCIFVNWAYTLLVVSFFVLSAAFLILFNKYTKRKAGNQKNQTS